MRLTTLKFTVGVMVMLTACKKVETSKFDVVSFSDQKLHLNQNLLSNPAANPQNPYDYLGYYHNIGLDSLRHFVKTNNDTTRAAKCAY